MTSDIIYKLNVEFVLKKILELGIDSILQRTFVNEMIKLNAKPGNIATCRKMIRFLLLSELITDKINFTLKDIESITRRYIYYERQRVKEQTKRRLERS